MKQARRPWGPGEPSNTGFKFRVSYRIREQGAKQFRNVEFQYPGLGPARDNYKAILLGFYKNKYMEEYAICLNRIADKAWENPIYYDSE